MPSQMLPQVDPQAAPLQSAPAPVARPLTGILWMLASGLLFTGVNVVVKHVGQTVPPAEAVFLRYAFGVLFVLPMLPAIRRAGFGWPVMGRVLGRGVVHALGVLLWFYAMAKMPIGEVTAMGYLQPVYITILAALFLGERLAARRLAAVAFAIVGALIVLRPGFRELSSAHLAMLFVTPLFAVSYTIAKRLTEMTSPAAVLAWMSVTVTVFLIPTAVAVWETPTLLETFWLFLTACFATAGHYCMLLAFRSAPITVTQPVTFLQLVWSVSIGALLFGEPVDGFVVLGGMTILGAVLFIAWREARLRQARAQKAEARPPQPGP